MQQFGQPDGQGGGQGDEVKPAPAWAPPTMYSPEEDEEQLTVLQRPHASEADKDTEAQQPPSDEDSDDGERGDDESSGRHAGDEDEDSDDDLDDDTDEVSQLPRVEPSEDVEDPTAQNTGQHTGQNTGQHATAEPVTPANPTDEQPTTMLSPGYAEEYARYAQAQAYEQQQAYAQQQQYAAQQQFPQGYPPSDDQYTQHAYGQQPPQQAQYPQGYVVPNYPTTGAPAGYPAQQPYDPQAQQTTGQQPAYDPQAQQTTGQQPYGYPDQGYGQPAQVYQPQQQAAPQSYAQPAEQQQGYPPQAGPAQAYSTGAHPYVPPPEATPTSGPTGQQTGGYPPAPPYPGHAAYPPAMYSATSGPPATSQPATPAVQSGQLVPTRTTPDIDAGRFVPTAEEFAARRAHVPTEPEPTMGLPALIKRLTFGMVQPAMSRREEEYREAVSTVRRNFGGLRQVTIVNPKGGAGKTVAVLMTAMTFGQNRGGYVLAWDNNETQGTLGMRAQPDFHNRTVRDVLDGLENFLGTTGKVGDLTSFVRSQGGAMFDVLASDESATAGEMLTASAFKNIREVVSRFYKLIIVDTGNNVRAENWQAAIDATDQLVVTMSARGDSAETAARMLDHLEQTGRAELVRKAITVVSMPASRKDLDLPAIERHFSARTRGVLHAPYEPLLDSGEPIRYEAISQRTRDSWLKIAAAVAEGL